MRKNYIPAWYAGFEQGKYKGQLDVAVITDPESRWNNYYPVAYTHLNHHSPACTSGSVATQMLPL